MKKPPEKFESTLPVVVVLWHDAMLHTGWDDFGEADLSTTLTVGFLRRKTKRIVEVIQSATAAGEFDAVFVIPRACVRSIVHLTPRRKR